MAEKAVWHRGDAIRCDKETRQVGCEMQRMWPKEVGNGAGGMLWKYGRACVGTVLASMVETVCVKKAHFGEDWCANVEHAHPFMVEGRDGKQQGAVSTCT